MRLAWGCWGPFTVRSLLLGRRCRGRLDPVGYQLVLEQSLVCKCFAGLRFSDWRTAAARSSLDVGHMANVQPVSAGGAELHTAGDVPDLVVPGHGPAVCVHKLVSEVVAAVAHRAGAGHYAEACVLLECALLRGAYPRNEGLKARRAPGLSDDELNPRFVLFLQGGSSQHAEPRRALPFPEVEARDTRYGSPIDGWASPFLFLVGGKT